MSSTIMQSLTFVTFMVANSFQMRIFGKVAGQFLHASWWLYSQILDAADPTALWTHADFG